MTRRTIFLTAAAAALLGFTQAGTALAQYVPPVLPQLPQTTQLPQSGVTSLHPLTSTSLGNAPSAPTPTPTPRAAPAAAAEPAARAVGH